MKINIVAPIDGWILNKFGQCVYNELIKMEINAVISQGFDSSADINHYFFANEAPEVIPHRTTFMVTHVDMSWKFENIKRITDMDAIAICMSRETMEKLVSWGVRRNRICYVNPAQDGGIRPRKVALGFTHKVHDDNRKRETMLIDICKQISPESFRFVIMGAGWEEIIGAVRALGFEVEYYPEFEKQQYNKLMLGLDYYCYFGFDEGSMGFLDAVAAGIGTIVTPQGYHLDTGCEITYPVRTINDIVDSLHEIENKNQKNLRFIKEWTWKNYTLKHMEIWKYMLNLEKRSKLLGTRGWYNDGIYSLLLDAPPCFPTYCICKGSRIVLWGAGKLGQKDYQYLKKSQYCEIVLWVDSAYEEKRAMGLDVMNREQIFVIDEKEYDYVFVAIARRMYAEDVQRYLLERHIPKEKILLQCDL